MTGAKQENHNNVIKGGVLSVPKMAQLASGEMTRSGENPVESVEPGLRDLRE